MSKQVSQPTPEIPWIEAADNPWGVRVLDVRPVTLNMLSTSKDPRMAQNAVSYGRDDGTGFISAEPKNKRVIKAGLSYRFERYFAEGALFIPTVMEHKWAIYYHQKQIRFIRSWQREVVAVARVSLSADRVILDDIQGTLLADDEPPEITLRVVDYLMRTHALDTVFPAPLPSGFGAHPYHAALWCMNTFGNRALVAAVEKVSLPPPAEPLRTHSLLHIAVARGDVEALNHLLAEGVPADLLARDGLAPLHWAVVRDETTLADILLAHGSSVDVRSVEGATPLMNAVQGHRHAWMRYLLDHGADPSAADIRGFTSLHRAAEMGDKQAVQILLERGAFPNPEVQGHTPLSLAKGRGETEIVEMLLARNIGYGT